MPRCAVLCGLVVDDQARLGRDAALEARDDRERRAPFELGIAGIDLDVGGAGFGEDGRCAARLANEPGWPGRWPRRSGTRGSPRGPVASTRSLQVGTVSSQSWARRWSRAWRMTADCRKPSRPDGVAASSSTAARRPVPSSGCLASMRRATQRVSRTERRAAIAHTDPGHRPRHRDKASSQPSGISFSPERRSDEPEAHAGQGPDEPADAPAQSRAARAGSAARPVPMLVGVLCSCRQGLRADRAGSIDGSPRQPGFEDQDADDRQGSASARASGGLPARRYTSAGAARGRHVFREWFARRTPNCSIVSTGSGAVLLSRGSRLTANDDRAGRRVDRVEAGLIRFVEERRSRRAIVTAVPSGLWTIMLLTASSATGSGTRSPTR